MKKETPVVETPIRGRSRLRSNLKEIYPDKEYSEDSEDDIEDFLAHHEEIRGKHDKLNESSKRIAEGIHKNPHAASLFNDIIGGGSPGKSIAKLYGSAVLKGELSEEELSELVEAEEERARERIAEEERTAKEEKTFRDNLLASETAFQEFAAENKLNPEQFSEFMGKFYNMFAEPIFQGRYTKEVLDGALKALNFDAEVSDAHESGRVAAKNEKINKQFRRSSGDGLPGISSAGTINVSEKNEKKPERKTIWDLG